MLKIYLDMDGVCADFIGSAVKHFDNGADLLKNWPKDKPDIVAALGISPDYFWKHLDGIDFWVKLKEFPWFWNLYNSLKDSGDVYFCTTPSQDPQSLSGKLEWLQGRFGKRFRNYILTPHKYLLADENSVLIDDNPEQCRKFEQAGGGVILFPAINNKNSEYLKDPLKYVFEELNTFQKRKAKYSLGDLF